MDRQELDSLKQWFTAYCTSFHTQNPGDQRNISLKEAHTHNVCDNMAKITRELSLDGGLALLAQTVALFHDVGRFPQYRKYRTFVDRVSTNHAALGAKVLIENNVLRGLTQYEQDCVIRAVTLHNVFTIPAGLGPDPLLLLRMVRDADKLDIWRVFIEYDSLPEEDRPTAATLGLPDTPSYSPEVLASLHRRGMVQLSALRTLNDFKLLQLAWIFDLNVPVSLRMLIEREYIDKMAALLPRTKEIGRTVEGMRNYVSQRLKQQ